MTTTKIKKEELERLKNLIKEDKEFKDEIKRLFYDLVGDDINKGKLDIEKIVRDLRQESIKDKEKIINQIKDNLYEELKLLVFEEVKSQRMINTIKNELYMELKNLIFEEIKSQLARIKK